MNVLAYLCDLPRHRGIDPSAFTNQAISCALWNGHVNTVAYLCDLARDRGVDPLVRQHWAIEQAAFNGHVDVIRYVCDDRSVDPSAYNHFMSSAASGGHVNVVAYMCDLPRDRGVDPSAHGNQGIQVAASSGHVHVVRYLCDLPRDRGVDPSANDNEAIKQAASHGHLDVVRYLCDLPRDRGVNPSANDNQAIKQAASYGRLDVVRYLFDLPRDRGVDPSACSIVDAEELSARQVAVVRYLRTWRLSQRRHNQLPPAQVPGPMCSMIGNSYRARMGRSWSRRPVLSLHAMVRHLRATSCRLVRNTAETVPASPVAF